MNTQQKYDRIMEEMADKTLSFGCKIEIGNYIVTIGNDEGYCIENGLLRSLRGDCDFCRDSANYSIIGHPLHIGDVLYYLEKAESPMSKFQVLHHLWKDKRLPLSPTDTELVEYIYSLID